MKKFAIAALALAALAGTANADFVTQDLTGWQSDGGFLAAGNTSATITIPAGSQITAISFEDLEFTTQNGSFLNEFVISVNDGTAGDFWDFRVSTFNGGGTFGPASGSAPVLGLFGSGPFTTTTDLFVTVYETFNDTGIDAVVASGILTITYTAIPTPGAMALLSLGGLAATRRRRA
ncbi:MAG: hypothetical protein K2X32_07535 [Phycisphaerales bacterium]|nr:hypothetical protein [Phycisphaerales bacterium]